MDRDPGDRRRASLRASDADREQFVAALRRHHAEGRLTTEELSERTERAYAARTFGDLDALATDLPPIQPPAPASAPAPGRPASAELPPRMRPPGPKRAAAKANLVRSVLWFGTLSVVLIIIWAATNFGGYFWPVWPILGFMLAIAGQLFYVYGPARFDDDQPQRDR
jgi:Domain of unknown function (DUF1707)/2TM domain